MTNFQVPNQFVQGTKIRSTPMNANFQYCTDILNGGGAASGYSGFSGATGATGGVSGVSGYSGRSGYSGTNGSSGVSGYSGSSSGSASGNLVYVGAAYASLSGTPDYQAQVVVVPATTKTCIFVTLDVTVGINDNDNFKMAIEHSVDGGINWLHPLDINGNSGLDHNYCSIHGYFPNNVGIVYTNICRRMRIDGSVLQGIPMNAQVIFRMMDPTGLTSVGAAAIYVEMVIA